MEQDPASIKFSRETSIYFGEVDSDFLAEVQNKE